ncbi:MAG TPA: GTP cyclohydrolase I, partial [Candidatus Dormibacteraeota bacterium]|nr:GTP cyclohydrolase I [Candidatus Dormibacteraeota bacterium]
MTTSTGQEPRRPRPLPDHVRALVDEMETEIGEESAIEGDTRTAGASSIEGADGAPDENGVEAAVRQILSEIGEDPDRPGLVGTPDRVHRMYKELTAGYHVDPD